MSGPYRGSSEIYREQLRSLNHQIERVENRYTDFFWYCVAPELELDSPIRDWDLRVFPMGPRDDDILQVIAARERRLHRLKILERRFVDIEREWTVPSRHVPAVKKPITDGTGYRATRNVDIRAFEATIDFLATSATVFFSQTDDSSQAGFLVDDVPYRAACEGRGPHLFTLRTTITKRLGRVQLSQQGIVNSALIAAGLAQDIVLGDPDFDPQFVVQGHEISAKRLLREDVRQLLLHFPKAKCEAQELIAADGLVTFTWRNALSRHDIAMGVHALKVIRMTQPTMLLRDDRRKG